MNSALSAVGNAPVKSSMLLGFVRHKKNLESLDPEPKSHWQTCKQDACQCLPNSPCCLGKWTRPTEKKDVPPWWQSDMPRSGSQRLKMKTEPRSSLVLPGRILGVMLTQMFLRKTNSGILKAIARPNQCSALHPASCFLLGKWLD